MSATNLESEKTNYIVFDISEPKLAQQLPIRFINEGERKSTSFKINVTLHKLLKACAALQDRQEGDLVNEAIADLLIKYDYLDVID